MGWGGLGCLGVEVGVVDVGSDRVGGRIAPGVGVSHWLFALAGFLVDRHAYTQRGHWEHEQPPE